MTANAGTMRLTARLEAARLDLTAEEIADALWLASYLPASSPALDPQDVDATLKASTPDNSDSVADSLPGASPQRDAPIAGGSPVEPAEPPSKSVRERQTAAGSVYTISKGSFDSPRRIRGVTIRSKGGRALPDALAIARSLKPLMRTVPSRHDFILDEEATAQQFAENAGFWWPVLSALPERWLDVALVVDNGPTMVVWDQVVVELNRLLACQGAFRDVREWRLDTTGQGPVLYRKSTGSQDSDRPRSIRELADPTGKRLVLVLTDGLSAAWRDGALANALETWAAMMPIALIHLLPQRLWPQTGPGSPVCTLRALAPGMPNTRLVVQAARSSSPFAFSPGSAPALAAGCTP